MSLTDDFKRAKIGSMKTSILRQRVKLAIIRAGYGRPGGQTDLAQDLGIPRVVLNKALNGHYKDAYTKKILEPALEYLKFREAVEKENGQHAKAS
jgi:hypothetical protein